MEHQRSESVPLYLMLALSGGSMDAYSYLCRDHVFANAQTGNMLLFGVHLAQRNMPMALRYLWPVLAFTMGIVLSDLIRNRIQNEKIHWRQVVLVAEIVILGCVCWISRSFNLIANGLISFVCGLQVESFRSANGNSITTTMCIGNLRSGTNHIDRFIQYRNQTDLKKALLYYSVIVFFVIGAVLESLLIRTFHQKALFFSVGLLCLSFLWMLAEPNAGEDI